MNSPGTPRLERISTLGRVAGALMVLAAISAVYALDLPALRDNRPARRAAALPPPELPTRIAQCETYTAPVCGTWTLQPGGVYRAEWDDGTTATIRVKEFTGTSVWASRVDHQRGVSAEYSGAVSGGESVVSGNVRWSAGRQSRAGSWTANWEPVPGPHR